MLSEIVERLESLRINLLGIVVAVLAVGAARDVVESILLRKTAPLIDGTAQVAFFYLASFMAAGLIMSLFSGASVRRVLRMTLFGAFWIILAPPLVDYFILGRTVPYSYLTRTGLLLDPKAFLFLSPSIGTSVALGIGLFLVLSTIYVAAKSRSWWRSVLYGISSYLLVLFLLTPDLYMYVPRRVQQAASPAGHSAVAVWSFTFYLLVSLVLLGLVLWRDEKRVLIALAKSFTPGRPLWLLLLASLGLAIAGHVRFSSLGLLYAGLAVLAIGLMWLAATRVEAFSETGETTHVGRGVFFTLLAVLISFLIGWFTPLFVLLFILASLAYNVEPFRLRKYRFGSVVIGVIALLAYLIGYSTANFDVFLGLSTPAIVVGAGILLAFSLTAIIPDRWTPVI